MTFIVCHSKEKIEAGELEDLFTKKCQVRKIEPDLSGLTSDNLKQWNKEAWENQMKPLMKNVPDFLKVWEEWVSCCLSTLFHKFDDVFAHAALASICSCAWIFERSTWR